MVEEKSPYELLRVAPTASQDEVRAAYKSTALQNHPDRGGDPLAWAAIQRAYDTLVDAQKRAVYDRTRQGPATNAEASFTQSFGEGAFDLRDEAAASSAAPSTPKGMNIEAQVANAGTLANAPSGGGLSHGAGFDAWMRNQKGLGKTGFYTAEDLLRSKHGGISASDDSATLLPPLSTTAVCYDRHGPPEEAVSYTHLTLPTILLV